MSFQIIEKYFKELSSDQKSQLEKLGLLYEEWNEVVNLVSRKDIDHIYERHILHSMAIAKEFNFKAGTDILDIGTGGGLPGIPLAILFPDVQFLLVDSIGKKIKAVNEIIESLGLKNVKGVHSRGEQVNGKFDYVVCRAVTRLNKFIPWTKGKIKNKMINLYPNGLICLKGGDLKHEISEINKDSEIFEISNLYDEEFFETKKIVYIRLI